jgi:uncharacterized protein
VGALCNGGCPKDRFAVSRDGEAGHNYLCAGLELFFTQSRHAMETMAKLYRDGRPPSDVMGTIAIEDKRRGPYALCPCGSGRKFKFCHGNNTPRHSFDPGSSEARRTS